MTAASPPLSGRPVPPAPDSAPRPTLRASAVIFVDGRLLLVRQRRGVEDYWLLPGGGVHFGESLAAAVHREVREELAIDAVARRPIALVESISPEPERYAKHVLHIIFDAVLASAEQPARGTDAAVLEFRTVTRAELGTLRMAPPLDDFLEGCFEALPDRLVYLGLRW